MNKGDTPLISIGMPVFNGELTIRSAIDSILNQTYKNFELIISNNRSTDLTHAICQEYADADERIKYICQSENIGSALNFKFVLERASGKYFMWAACDDVRSSDFLYDNTQFLEANSSFVASTSPNCMEGKEQIAMELVNFDLKGTQFDRFKYFFDNCWKSHGIFYSLIITAVLRECEVVGQSFIAADWAIDLYLASCVNINRVKRGFIVFGAKGISSRRNAYRAFRNQPIEIFFPFYRLTCYVLKLAKGLTYVERLYLLRVLLRLNVKAVYDQSYSNLYQFYCSCIKPLRNSN